MVYEELLSNFAFNFNLRRYSLVLLLHRPPHHCRRAGFHGRPVQVDPMKLKFKPPGTERLKLKCDVPLSIFAFSFNSRRYIMVSCCRPVGGLVITGRARRIRSKYIANPYLPHFLELNSVSAGRSGFSPRNRGSIYSRIATGRRVGRWDYQTGQF